MAIERKKYIDFLLKQKDKDIVKIITGIRRCGKSTLLFELFYEEIKKLGVPTISSSRCISRMPARRRR